MDAGRDERWRRYHELLAETAQLLLYGASRVQQKLKRFTLFFIESLSSQLQMLIHRGEAIEAIITQLDQQESASRPS